MSLRLARLWPLFGLLFAGPVLALGLGDIELDSALNEPLRAQIRLVSASPEDLTNLKVSLASAETFERYGLHRPLFLTRLTFTVEPSGNVVTIRSQEPMTEPFVTFLVEATWPRGRLLREYTVLLDPPTFAPPPAAQSGEAVTAPRRAEPADSGRIERPAPAAAPRAAAPEPASPAAEAAAADTAPGDTVYVQRGDTLWGIAERVQPDSPLMMNQTMLAIYEANPAAFEGNINRLRAGATLTIPSADAIFEISRSDAMSEVERQNAAYGFVDEGGRTEPRLTLVPPDGEQEDYRGGAAGPGAGEGADAAAIRQAEDRIRELESTVAEQQSLIEVRDNELAQLREELARLRGEAAAAPAAGETPAPATGAETPATEAPAAAEDPDRVFAEEEPPAAGAEEPATAADEAEEAEAPATAAPQRPARSVPDEPGLVERAIEVLTGFWGILGVVLVIVLGLLIWLARRAAGRSEEESTGVWDALDAGEDIDSESRSSTERLRALARDDDTSIVVVEQETSPERRTRRGAAAAAVRPQPDELESTADTATPSLEDTFSSETAINLDQTDPVAEADFHMAYGLYDQAADLINGALAVEPERQDLMAKLCEIYFVWGNRDAFVEAANRLHDQLGGETTPDWDKIVIMGRQIAADHRLFAGATAGGATRAVDLRLDDTGGAGALDMDFAGGPDGEVSDVVDLTADDRDADRGDGLDFVFDEEPDTGASTTREMPGRAVHGDEPTVESPTLESRARSDTVETPTIEQAFGNVESTSELPTLVEPGDDALRAGDATAEIDLDDLGLDLDDLEAGGLGEPGDDFAELDETRESGMLGANDDLDATGRNEGLDDDLETEATGRHGEFDLDALAATGEMPAGLEEATGKNPALSDADDDVRTDVDLDLDASLLEATGYTQVLDEVIGDDDKTLLAPRHGDDAETLLAAFDDEEGYEATAALSRGDVDIDFDFAKTEALPKDAFSPGASADETGEMPALAGITDVDLDLDDLTAALRYSEGDTVDQPRDDATVERPRLRAGQFIDLDVGDAGNGADETPTQALAAEDFEDDLHDARTMTEVGTKLDLARAYVDMGDPEGARSILDEVLDEGDEGQRQQAQKLIDSLPT